MFLNISLPANSTSIYVSLLNLSLIYLINSVKLFKFTNKGVNKAVKRAINKDFK
jgi:hypothetical protein